MRVRELFESTQIDWDAMSKQTQTELTKLFDEKVSFHGGYCFHLALAMFLKSKKQGANVAMIADGGHVAVYDYDKDVSVDEYGEHNYEDALNGRREKTWKSAAGLLKAMQKSWADKEQLDRLDQIFQAYK